MRLALRRLLGPGLKSLGPGRADQRVVKTVVFNAFRVV